MKHFLMSLLLLIANPAFAGNLSYPVPHDTIGIQAIDGVILTDDVVILDSAVCASLEPCPPMEVQFLEIQFRLGGCMDKLASVSWEVDQASSTLYVSAYKAISKSSSLVKCKREPTENVKISLGEDRVKNVKFLGVWNGPYIHPTPF